MEAPTPSSWLSSWLSASPQQTCPVLILQGQGCSVWHPAAVGQAMAMCQMQYPND